MSVNAIGSTSIYSFYYQLNQASAAQSSVAEEMKKYNLESTGDEDLDKVLLEQAKQAEQAQQSKKTDNVNKDITETSNKTTDQVAKEDRPWSDIMNQLGIQANDNPKDDIDALKKALVQFISGTEDEDGELSTDIEDLIKSLDSIYNSFVRNPKSTSNMNYDYQLFR